jgi:hypothetical protein
MTGTINIPFWNQAHHYSAPTVTTNWPTLQAMRECSTLHNKICCNAGCLDPVLEGFPHSLQINAGTLHVLTYDHFVPNSSIIIPPIILTLVLQTVRYRECCQINHKSINFRFAVLSSSVSRDISILSVLVSPTSQSTSVMTTLRFTGQLSKEQRRLHLHLTDRSVNVCISEVHQQVWLLPIHRYLHPRVVLKLSNSVDKACIRQ